MTKTTRRSFYTFLALPFILGACTPVAAQRGNMLEDYQIADVQAGTATQSDVLRALGSPTTVSTFDARKWYYIGQETEKRGIMDAEIVKERIVEVTFNDEGIVQDIRDVDAERLDVPYARGKTPTHGQDLTFTQQLLGNLGRFNTEEEK